MRTDKEKMKGKTKNRIFFFLAVLACLICIAIIGICIKEIAEKRTTVPQESHKGKGENTEKVKRKQTDETQNTEKPLTEAEKILSEMTLEQKAAQLFVVTPEDLTGEEAVTQAGEIFHSAYEVYPVGGFIMMQGNIVSPDQIVQLNGAVEELSVNVTGLKPFLAVDEEGGTVARIAGSGVFPVENVGNMCDIGFAGDTAKAYETGAYIGGYLAEYGFNVDFAPDADVWSNPANEVVRYRAFGSDAQLVSSMVSEAVDGFHSAGICTSLKHFPGHGGTSEDSHDNFAYSDRSLEELRSCEFLPFQAGIEAGSEFVMVGHITLPQIAESDTPATLSKTVVTDILRGELGYTGIIITDAMNMGAIAQNYSADRAAVQAVQAGIDMLLMPSDFYSAYQGILDAVKNGEITEQRLDESVKRIIDLKLKL
ncbi:glycoside hydrolase family 3 protein [Mediterraneibacter sp. NSJ-55]|uniref:beta-N-acetylhexosaminidase n=1 Tax=Mediterraneibacter hominis TaxID=2763054 RepID=A0A923LHI3_9FIRM|nr:glycoside hydrolase family 3 protein [Mediterraneibacter hominis]MBC5688766.1 glycoside hydrolase family 3 protein [Mediterraneibacter hominis]